MTVEDMSVAKAVELFQLPRELGKHPEDKKKVVTAIGRFGPFVKHEKEYRSLKEGQDVFSITLDEALALLAEPKGRRAASTKKVIKELGKDPASGEEVSILDGRYGPYVKLGKTNASLPKGAKPEEFTLEKALELIEQKSAP
jgi:DNA topoisomerase-1